MWTPWVGPDYARHRLLLLGESCYSWRDRVTGELMHPRPDHPGDIVRESLGPFPVPGQKFTTKIVRALCDSEWPNPAQVSEAWDQVAFTNYVPVSVGEGPGRPSEEAWRRAREEWSRLLQAMGPRNIVVLGLDLWKKLPWADGVPGGLRGRFELVDGSAATCWKIRHPSRGPGWKEYAALIRSALHGVDAPANG